MGKKNKRGQNEGSIWERFKKTKDGKKVLIGWEARYTAGTDQDGKQIQRSIYGSTSEEVKQKLRKILTCLDEGTYIEPKKIKVSQWLDTWFENYKKPTVKPNTLACYENIIKKHINPAIGDILLRDLRADNVQKLYNNVSRNYSKRMVELTHITLHNALKQAIKNDLIYRNVTDLVDLPKGKDQRDGSSEKLPRVLTVDEQDKLLKSLKGERLEAAILLMLFTGLRRGELLGLMWDDIDLDEKVLHVNRIICRYKNYDEEANTKTKLDIGSLKTPKSKRDIPLLDDLIPALKALKNSQKAEKMKAGEAYNKINNLVVCNEIGEPIDPRMFKKMFDRILEKAGMEKLKMPEGWKPGEPIPENFKFPKWFNPPEGWKPGKPLPIDFKPPEGVNIHAMRHTFATRGLENGILHTNRHTVRPSKVY